MNAVFFLLALGVVPIEVEAAVGLERDVVRAVIAELRSAIEADAASRNDHRVVRLRLFSGLTKIRIVAERSTTLLRDPIRAEVDIPLDTRAWAEPLRELVGRLYPRSDLLPRVVTSSAAIDSSIDAVPLILADGSFAAAAVAIGFAISSLDARQSVENGVLTSSEVEALSSRMQTHATVSGALAAAAAGLFVVTVYVAFDL